MSKPTLDSIAAAKAKLAEELRNLEVQETELRKQQAAKGFGEVMRLLGEYREHFSAKHRAEILAMVGSGDPAKARKESTHKEIAPKYWLPHTQETWSGRGRPPRSFSAWIGTAAYKEWKAAHPNEKFPGYPG